ncbi:MAG: phospho-N-acetylmuramoyl-pentapeptide-transferase [Phycisphaerales bacterium]|nr:phospho-N-acetylmuramoyl-pentapeptide-transferase [Phycisphaerales bacterium]
MRSWLEGQHYAYENALFRGTCGALFCFLFIVLIGPAVIRQLVRLKVGDRPEFDHATLNELTANKRDVPTMGGLMILGAVALGTLLLADLTNFYVRMGLACLLWLGLLGGVDDWKKLTSRTEGKSRDGLKSYQKILFQVGLAVILGFFIFRHGQRNFAVIGAVGAEEQIESYRVLMVPFYKHGVTLGAWAFMLVTVLVVTGTSNAVNFTDGMDGLASGCVALCCMVFMLLAFAAGTLETATKLLIPHIPQSEELAVLSGCMMGSALGFLWYNCHPAKVFMGDTGSLALGGMIGYIAIVTRQELMLFLVGGVFVMEAMSVILQIGYFKLTRGKRLFLVAPIHHHFHLSGWSEPQTVIRFWLLGAVFAVFALATVKLR